MGIRIFLSPSNQYGNKYSSIDTDEGTVMGLLASILEKRLLRAGFETMLMHDDDMPTKVKRADAWKADLYIPLHSNAANNSRTGTHIFYWSKNSKGYEAGLAIFNELAPYCPGTDDKMIQDQTLYEIRMPEAPTVYIETDFHDVPEVAAWIVDHLPEMADRIAAGICHYFNVPAPGKKYSVCIGTYETEAEASAAAASFRIIEEV